MIRLGSPHGTQDAVAIKLHQVREEAGTRNLRSVGQREHLDIATPDAEVVAVPLDRSMDELAVHANIRAEAEIGGPLLKIEEIAEELKRLLLAEQFQTNRIAHVRFEDRRGLLQIEELPVCLNPLLLWLAAKRILCVRFDGQTPVEVDAPKAGGLIEKLDPVVCEGFSDRIQILALPGQIEAGDDAGVLIEAGALRQTAQGGLDAANANVQIVVGTALGVDPAQRKEAPVSAALQGVDVRADEVGQRHNAAGRASPGKPGSIICAGHSSSSASGSRSRVETSWGVCEPPAMRRVVARES